MQERYEELLSRTAQPVGVRKGMVDAIGNSQARPVVLGPNTCMDLPADASFEFVDIRARSLAEHRAWRQILDDTIRRDALIPSQKRGAARTEMEITSPPARATRCCRRWRSRRRRCSPPFCSTGVP